MSSVMVLEIDGRQPFDDASWIDSFTAPKPAHFVCGHCKEFRDGGCHFLFERGGWQTREDLSVSLGISGTQSLVCARAHAHTHTLTHLISAPLLESIWAGTVSLSMLYGFDTTLVTTFVRHGLSPDGVPTYYDHDIFVPTSEPLDFVAIVRSCFGCIQGLRMGGLKNGEGGTSLWLVGGAGGLARVLCVCLCVCACGCVWCAGGLHCGEFKAAFLR